jgi:exosortase
MTPAAQQSARSVKPAWLTLAGLGCALLLVYFPTLRHLVWQWRHDEDMGHGFFVPLVAAYIVWSKREELRRIPVEPCWWGIPVMLFAAAQAMVGSMGAELFLSRTALLESLVGILLLTAGKRFTRALAFPLLLLCFMIPIPQIVYSRITFPLQLLASRLAEAALEVVRIPVLRNGNVLELPGKTLSVVEACSGIRSLLSLGFLGLVYGYFMETRPWVRVALFVAVPPIAIAANALRVTMTGVLSHYWTELSGGAAHSFEGWLIFMLSLGMLFLLHRLLGRLAGLRRKAH